VAAADFYFIKIVSLPLFSYFMTMMQSPERKMFFGSKPVTFIRARNLRENMTNAEHILWNRVRNNQLLGFRFKA